MKKYRKRLLILLAFIVVIIAVYKIGLADYLTFETLKAYKTDIQRYVSSHFVLSVLLFVVVYITVTGLSLPGATILTLSGGFVFGTIPAAIFVNIGATIGATIAFLLARYLLGEWVQARFQDQLLKFNREMDRYGKYYLLTLRFAPLFPFMWINLFSGLTKIPAWTYIWTTSLGIIPGSLVYAHTGNQLSRIDSLGDIVSAGILIAFILLSLLAFTPVAIQKLRNRNKGTSPAAP